MANSILLTSSFSSIPRFPKHPKFIFSTPKLIRTVKPINNFSNGAFLKNPQLLPSRCLIKSGKVFVLGESDRSVSDDVLVGEDSAKFELAKQKISSWIYFTAVLGVVLFILDITWLDNSTGFGKVFIDSVSSVSDSPEVVMFLLTLIFAFVHSGLATVRDPGEKLIGERAFRVLFAGTSLPLAVSTIVYFIDHRYDGVQLWQLQSVPWLHHLLWVTNFISFFFLYPSTFNLLEVAAIDKPKMHLWESGIMRITRHPQVQQLFSHIHANWPCLVTILFPVLVFTFLETVNWIKDGVDKHIHFQKTKISL